MNNNQINDNSEQGADTLSVGKQLAGQRRRREISIRQVSEQIKLPGWVIEALEADRMEQVAPLYLRGYVRNYANFLGLDAEALLSRLEQRQAPELRPVLPVSQTGIKFERLIKFSTYLLVTTLIVPPLVYFFVVGGVRVFEREVVDASNPASSQPLNVSQRIAEALAIAEPGDEDSEPGHLAASAVPLNNLRPLEDASSLATSTLATEVLPPETQTEAIALSTLALELTEDSWIEIESADGQRLEFDLLRAGTQRSYQASPPFRLLIGRANAVRITLDGEVQQFSGQDQGSVVELNLGQPSLNEPLNEESG